MKTIEELLTKEKELNKLLNKNKAPENIDDDFKKLFESRLFKETSKWYGKNEVFTFHDSCVSNLSQRKKENSYKIQFNLDSTPIYENDEETGYIKDSQLKIVSSQSLRDINNRFILSFLIDEEKKEIGFLYLDKNKSQTIIIKYDEIKFIKGKEIKYGKEEKKTFNYD